MLRYFSPLPLLHLSSFAPHTTCHPRTGTLRGGAGARGGCGRDRCRGWGGWASAAAHVQEGAWQLLRDLPHLSRDQDVALFPSECHDGAAKPVTHFHTALSSRLSPAHAPPRLGLLPVFSKPEVTQSQPAMFQHTRRCFRVSVLLNAIIPKFCPSPVSPDMSPPCSHRPRIQQSRGSWLGGRWPVFRSYFLTVCSRLPARSLFHLEIMSYGRRNHWKTVVINCSGQARGRIDLSFLWVPSVSCPCQSLGN